MSIEQITPDQVTEVREKWGLGIMDAKRFLLGNREKAVLEKLIAEGSIEEKVDYLLKADLDKINHALHEGFGKYGIVEDDT